MRMQEKGSLPVQILVGEAVEVGVQLDWRGPLVQLQGVQLGHEVPIHLQSSGCLNRIAKAAPVIHQNSKKPPRSDGTAGMP